MIIVPIYTPEEVVILRRRHSKRAGLPPPLDALLERSDPLECEDGCGRGDCLLWRRLQRLQHGARRQAPHETCHSLGRLKSQFSGLQKVRTHFFVQL